jgi:NSS family neurotransmitter:Na+ symporter
MAQFGSKIGIILATAGSAVGLGNIWRFPTTTGENGGAAFILVYLLFTLLLGIPGMMSEFIVGRNGGGNAFRAYLKAGGKSFSVLGIVGMICCAIILGFYSVVAGWCMYYFFSAVCDNVLGDKTFIADNFSALVAGTMVPVSMTACFVLLTHFIIVRGVQNGIEKASKVMMPILFILLLVLIMASCSLPGAWKGIEFLFYPDFSKITPAVAFEALGQAFFSLSLGTAVLCTYASYFKDETNLLRSASQIIFIDMMVAILAGLMIFPAAFSVGIEPDAGPSLIFITLPNVFEQAFPHAIAYVVSIVFFALLSLAALTSTISMHEVGTSIVSEEAKLPRRKAAMMVTTFCIVIGILSALSLGPVPMGFGGKPLFDNFDKLTSDILLPAGSFFTTLLVGWAMPRKDVIDQLTSKGLYPWKEWGINIFFFLVRFICPLFILTIFLYKMEVI